MSAARIAEGAKFPDVEVTLVVPQPPKADPNACVRNDASFQKIKTGEYLAGKKIVLFSVPGAFTPTCSEQHLPGFVAHVADFKAKGVDAILCHAVNDQFVLKAWAQERQTGDALIMVADGTGALTQALGLELDLTAYGLGKRSERFAMVIEDGVVKTLRVDPGGSYSLSSAESILSTL